MGRGILSGRPVLDRLATRRRKRGRLSTFVTVVSRNVVHLFASMFCVQCEDRRGIVDDQTACSRRPDIDTGGNMPKGSKAPQSSRSSLGDRDSKAASQSNGAAGKGDAKGDRETQVAVQASDKLYYRIGEVSELTNVKAHVLRYWETEFRWMAPPKSRSKQRLYRKRDIEFVLLLKRLLWEERYTIAGARQRIQELGVEGALGLLSEPPLKAASRDKHAGADWVAFGVAIDEMRDDLVAVRGVLQGSA